MTKGKQVKGKFQKNEKNPKTSKKSGSDEEESIRKIYIDNFSVLNTHSEENGTNVSNLEISKNSSKREIELKPCKGSITRILMDEGMEGYKKRMEEISKIEKERKMEWRESRMNEYCGLTERESDEIPYKVYDHILYHNTPWKSFEQYLNETEEVRTRNMENCGLIEKEKEPEWITHPLTGEYYQLNKVDDNEEKNYYINDYEDDYYENEYDELEYESEYEWEEDYEDLLSSEDDFSDDEY